MAPAPPPPKPLTALRVAVVSWPDPLGMAASIVRGMQEIGVDAHLVDYAPLRGPVRWLGDKATGVLTELASAVRRPPAEAALVRTLVALQPDVILFLKCDDLHGAVYHALRRLTRARLAAFHPDDPFNVGGRVLLGRRRGGPSHPRALIQLRLVDTYLTWSRALVDRARGAGARAVHYLPFACDPTLHPRRDPADTPAELRADVTFIGTWDRERERWLAALADLEGVDFALWGPLWSSYCSDPALLRAWRGRGLVGEEMAQAVAGSAININILRGQNKGACNMRTFEIPSAGGFMLHESSPEVAAIFPPGVACDEFDTPEALRAQVRRYLADPEARRRVAEEGHRVAREHSYAQWGRRALALVTGATDAPTEAASRW